MELPDSLIRQVRLGRTVLFLGAGASSGATLPNGSSPPFGDELRDRIAKEFLGPNAKGHSLAWAAELAISANDLFEVQGFIADQFREICPAKYHELIPTFRWRGIATTNYDMLVETVYNAVPNRVQVPVPFLHNGDRVDRMLREGNVALLKLHGCVTRTTDESLPLILTAEQYMTYRENRSRLFNMLEEWGSENTIIFIGHRLQDPNVREILLEMTRRLASRPRYYLIRPAVDQVEKEFWATKQISVIDSNFEDLLKALDAAIDSRTRPLAAKLSTEHTVHKRFVKDAAPSQALLEFLHTDVEYVHEGIAYEGGDPKQFYKGFGLGWYPIIEELDVRRQLVNQIIQDVVLRPEEDRPSQVELYTIKAEAGAGKTILIRRIAWDAATQAGVLCLRARGTTLWSLEALRELSEATSERVFLFIDNAADHIKQIRSVLDFARERKIRLTIITAERINEWNVSCDSLNEYLSDEYQLPYLSEKEIGTLVDLLDKHDAVGPNLENKTRDQRIEEFVKRAGRQLLVVLHEATRGIPFEEILLDEYNEISPPEAQRLYLSVCVLNRLRVPVRAGLISRVHGIPFEDFQRRLFGPLEHVVLVSELSWGDYGYCARHSEIAQIVFERVLTDAADRFNEYVRLLKALNPIYSVDLEAIRGLTRAKRVHELFPNNADVVAVYAAAEEVLGEDSYLMQQRANYERIRPEGNLRLAESLLERAREKDPDDPSLVHTLAEVLRARAKASNRALERTRFRAEARALLRTISQASPSSRYATVTCLKLTIDDLGELFDNTDATDRALDEAIRNADRTFEAARQRYPADNYILLAEADLAKLLNDHERSISALERARIANPRDPFIASRLAALLADRGNAEKAKAYLEEALESNRGDKRLNFQYAELLRTTGLAKTDELIYYYRRAFTKWDANHESQFWFARFAFESQDLDNVREAREVFRHLRDVPMSYEKRIAIRDAIGSLDSSKRFSGTIARIEATHGFAVLDGRGDWVFFHKNDLEDGIWGTLTKDTRVAFFVGFSLRGPKAFGLREEGSVI